MWPTTAAGVLPQSLKEPQEPAEAAGLRSTASRPAPSCPPASLPAAGVFPLQLWQASHARCRLLISKPSSAPLACHRLLWLAG